MNEQLRQLVKQLIRKTRSKHAVWHTTRQRQEYACYMQSGLVIVDRYRRQSGAEVCDLTLQNADGAPVVYLSTDSLESVEDRQLLDELHRAVVDRVLNISGTLDSMLSEIENSSDVGFNDPPL